MDVIADKCGSFYLFVFFLKGMLIYIPATSRAGIAVLICMVCIANLNFFEPHKNRVLFWLSQISFLTTASKYTVALLIASSVKKQEEKIIGPLLIGLDVFFMVSSMLAIVISLLMLRSKVVAINKRSSKEMHSLVKVQPDKGEERGGFIENIKGWRITEVNTSTPALVGAGTAGKKKNSSAVKKKVGAN